MITGNNRIRISALVCAMFLAMLIFTSLPSRTDAGPDNLVRRTRKEAREKKNTEEEKKEEDKKDDKAKDDDKDYPEKPASSSQGSHHYHSYKDTSYQTHYSYWSPYYQRIVDIYFTEAYARLNEGFFYDEEEGIEYLAGEWFDLVLDFETYAVVPGEDIKIVYRVKDYEGDELYWGKEFRPIYAGSNERTIFRAFPSKLLSENSRLYIDVTLTIEGNNAYGGFWLETLPVGNEGPLRVGDVIVAAPVSGGESNPLYNLIEGNQYKLYAEYDIDYYLGDYAGVQWRLYDSDGLTITEGSDYIEARAGYGYYTTLFAIPDVAFSGTRDCYLDVRIESAPYLGRIITEIKVTGTGTGHASSDNGYTGGANPVISTPYRVTFIYAEIQPLNETQVKGPYDVDQDLRAIIQYDISGIQTQAQEQFKWTLSGPEGNMSSSSQSTTVSDGTLNRTVDLAIRNSFPAGSYTLNVEIYLDNIYSGGKSLDFELLNDSPSAAPPDASSDENYFDFEGTSIFLPYEWEASKTADGVLFITANDIDGRFMRYSLEKSSGGVPGLRELADDFEADIAGVKLTTQDHLANGEDVVSTSFLEMSGGSAQSISLYAYYVANVQDDSFDLWVIEMTAGASDIQDIYDDLDEILTGLFIKN